LCDFPNSFYFWDEDNGIAKGYITATIHLLLTTDRDCSERAYDITVADLRESDFYGSESDGSPNRSTLREYKILTDIQHIPTKITIWARIKHT
jgi:hypothetical protein